MENFKYGEKHRKSNLYKENQKKNIRTSFQSKFYSNLRNDDSVFHLIKVIADQTAIKRRKMILLQKVLNNGYKFCFKRK